MHLLQVPWASLKTIFKSVIYVRDQVIRFSNWGVDETQEAVGIFDERGVQNISDGFFYSLRKFLQWSIKYPGFPGLFPIAPLVFLANSANAFPLVPFM
tara:strand:- start:496 stop:789 length:294 start_codon:yes stop_codon:yes gene_type:complete